MREASKQTFIIIYGIHSSEFNSCSEK